MSRWLRSWFVCLLVLALPLQGLAAATMAFCGPLQQAATAGPPGLADGVAAATTWTQPAIDTAGQAVGPGHHGHQIADAASAEATADRLSPSADAPGHHPGSHPDRSACSACAVCCAAVPLQSSLPTLPTGVATSAAPQSPAASRAVFTTGGPERPPRARLA